MRIRFLILFVLALAGAACNRARNPPQAEEPAPRIYLPVFGLTVGSDSRVEDFHLIKVIEPLSGTNQGVALELPPAYLESAKKTAEAAHLKPTLRDGKPSRTLTSFLHVPVASKASGSSAPRMSLESLDGVMNETTSFELMGAGCQLSVFGRPIGVSALFFYYYAVPLAKSSAEEREAVINAEIERCRANFGGAKLISKKVFPLADQSIVEATVKSPKSKVLTLRFRVICNARQMLGLSVVAPDNSDAAQVRALDKMFEEFRFR
jgi:hypothetical protein